MQQSAPRHRHEGAPYNQPPQGMQQSAPRHSHEGAPYSKTTHVYRETLSPQDIASLLNPAASVRNDWLSAGSHQHPGSAQCAPPVSWPAAPQASTAAVHGAVPVSWSAAPQASTAAVHGAVPVSWPAAPQTSTAAVHGAVPVSWPAAPQTSTAGASWVNDIGPISRAQRVRRRGKCTARRVNTAASSRSHTAATPSAWGRLPVSAAAQLSTEQLLALSRATLSNSEKTSRRRSRSSKAVQARGVWR